MGEIVVTVCLITYNHKRFIAEAIDSILIQKTNFDWEIVIADDYSTDGTRDILLEYARQNPSRIRLLLQEKNVGLHQNFIDLFTSPAGKYVAFLDGDDTWADELRLQKQVDFLEANPQYGMVYGRGSLMNEQGQPLPYRNIPPYKSGYVFEDILLRKFLPPMAAALMRNSEIRKIYQTRKEPGIDFYLIATLSKNNQVAFVDEVYFNYRINPASITSTQNGHMVELFEKIMNHYKEEYPALVKKGIRNGKRMFLYLVTDTNPTWDNFRKLLRNFNFSSMYFRQLAKCGLRLVGLRK